MESLRLAIDLLTAVAAVYAAVGVHFLRRDHQVVTGRVDEQARTLNAHVNAPGLHR